MVAATFSVHEELAGRARAKSLEREQAACWRENRPALSAMPVHPHLSCGVLRKKLRSMLDPRSLPSSPNGGSAIRRCKTDRSAARCCL